MCRLLSFVCFERFESVVHDLQCLIGSPLARDKGSSLAKSNDPCLAKSECSSRASTATNVGKERRAFFGRERMFFCKEQRSFFREDSHMLVCLGQAIVVDNHRYSVLSSNLEKKAYSRSPSMINMLICSDHHGHSLSYSIRVTNNHEHR